MIDFMDASQLSVIALALAAIVLVLVIALAIQVRTNRQHQTQQHDAVLQQLTRVEEQQHNLNHQIEEQQHRALVQGRHLQQLQTGQGELENQIRDVKLQDPSMRLYQRGAELVKQGATVEEVMEACDIPRAEAELIVTIHQNDGSSA
ncbi:DUF2802 domain-containing protein [Salinimonas lutimaris]|uniref:DUF2802 domain-containing protein n=1 Tax=Salinimonas lutimaris TaxID=914153 RepID=UPI001E61842E|nr:DUF2802 domain-containing protein [Salinimonas lutimaris]